MAERYIISERYLSARELYGTAAEAAGVRPPAIAIPLRVMSALGVAGDLAAKVLRRDVALSSVSVRLMHVMSPMSHAKAERELGWRPEPIHDAVHRAVAFYSTR